MRFLGHPFNEHFPFKTLSWKFEPCGRSGRFGPNQLLCDNFYKDTSLENLVMVNGGIQHWRAPVSGLIN